MEAGRAAFAHPGSKAATVEQVLAGAKVSRATFYANFADMDALLEAVVQVESDRIVEGVESTGQAAGGLRAALRRFGVNLLTFLSDPAMMAFERLLTAEAGTHPERARRFFDAGPKRAHDCLVAIVVAADSRREIVVPDAVEAVGDLIGLWMGFQRLEHAFGVVSTPTAAQIEARVDRCVAFFLRLHAPPALSGTPRRGPPSA